MTTYSERPIRLCVIGNSYTGAVKKVYSSDDSYGVRFKLSFFASVGAEFNKIDIQKGWLTNVNVTDGGSSDINDYDAFVIYGDIPLERTVLSVSNEANATAYSDRFRKARFRDWLNTFKSYRLCRDLISLTGKNVFVVSRNVPLTGCIGTPERRRIGLNIIQKALDPAMYIAMPDALFSADGHPRGAYYNGSLNVRGQAVDREKLPFHDDIHLNEVGGRLIFTAILDAVAEKVRL